MDLFESLLKWENDKNLMTKLELLFKQLFKSFIC